MILPISLLFEHNPPVPRPITFGVGFRSGATTSMKQSWRRAGASRRRCMRQSPVVESVLSMKHTSGNQALESTMYMYMHMHPSFKSLECVLLLRLAQVHVNRTDYATDRWPIDG